MRFFWSVVLAGGLLLVGLDVYQSRRDGTRSGSGARTPYASMEDGTGLPPPNPPPPPPPPQ